MTNDTSTGLESIEVFTTQLRSGNLFYAIGVAPDDAFSQYRGTFERIAESIRFNEN